MVCMISLQKGFEKLQKLYCPRLEHFVRFNANGSIGKCGHMVGSPTFSSWEEMENSSWLGSVKSQMSNNQWPLECRRCQKTEETEQPHSIRLNSIERDKLLSFIRKDYLILGGVLDNICNSACQTCSARLSTKIGSLTSNNYIKVDNSKLFKQIPRDRIVELDLNGGEPTASPAYQQILANLPDHVKVLRVNTNGSKVLPHLTDILKRNITVIITLSLDGVGQVHDYVRWPIKWTRYTKIVDQYNHLKSEYKNLKLQAWTTVSALNVKDFDNITTYARNVGLDHDWAFLTSPIALDPTFTNSLTQSAKNNLQNQDIVKHIATQDCNQIELDNYINKQDTLRNISIKDYL